MGWIQKLKKECKRELDKLHKKYGEPNGLPKPNLTFEDNKKWMSRHGHYVAPHKRLPDPDVIYCCEGNPENGWIGINIRCPWPLKTLRHEYKHHLWACYGLQIDSSNPPTFEEIIQLGKFFSKLRGK